MKKILIVEDNDTNIKLYKYMLKKIDAEMYYAKDGAEAYQKATDILPDLIIMDIQIPIMNGVEVTQKLRENPEFEKTYIIAVTAYSMRGDKERILQSGCDYYVSKPINTQKFPILIEQFLRNEIPQE